MNMNLHDKLYLEWSQITTARTAREMELGKALEHALSLIDNPPPELKGLVAREEMYWK